jgi:hypothetical protein
MFDRDTIRKNRLSAPISAGDVDKNRKFVHDALRSIPPIPGGDFAAVLSGVEREYALAFESRYQAFHPGAQREPMGTSKSEVPTGGAATTQVVGAMRVATVPEGSGTTARRGSVITPLTAPMTVSELAVHFQVHRNKMAKMLPLIEGAEKSCGRWRVPVSQMPPQYLLKERLLAPQQQ